MNFFLRLFTFREEKGGKEVVKHQYERNMDRLPLVHAPSGDQTCNPGMCPDQEWNWQPYALWDDT